MSEKVVFVKTFFFFDFDEDDIITNLADAAPGNDVFAFSAGKKTEFAGTWNDESSDGSCFAVELQPRLRQVQVLMTSFCLSSHNRMNLPLFIKDMQNLSEIYRCIS